MGYMSRYMKGELMFGKMDGYMVNYGWLGVVAWMNELLAN